MPGLPGRRRVQNVENPGPWYWAIQFLETNQLLIFIPDKKKKVGNLSISEVLELLDDASSGPLSEESDSEGGDSGAENDPGQN